MKLRTLIAGALVAAIIPATVFAGSVIVLSTEKIRGKSPAGTAVLYLDKERIRIDSNEGSDDVTVIYNQGSDDDGVFWLIDNRGRVYTEITREDMLAAKAEMDVALDMAEQELEELPPDQRKQAARVFAERVGLGSFMAGDITYTEVSSGIEIGGWMCNHYEGIQDGEKVQEVWAASFDELGISAADLRGLADIADLFTTVGQPLPPFFRMGGDDPTGVGRFPGFPVMIVSYTDGVRDEKSEVAEVRTEKLAAKLFALPDSLTERSTQIRR